MDNVLIKVLTDNTVTDNGDAFKDIKFSTFVEADDEVTRRDRYYRSRGIGTFRFYEPIKK